MEAFSSTRRTAIFSTQSAPQTLNRPRAILRLSAAVRQDSLPEFTVRPKDCPIIIKREAIGGQAGTSALIRNYLGFPRGISGAELAQRAYQQAWLFGAKYVLAREVSSLRANGADRILTLANGVEITAQVIVIATGASYQRLTTPGLERFVGAGVFYNTPADIRPFTDRNVCVIGSGNAAGQAVAHLAKTARQVVLAVRGDRLEKGMSDYMAKELQRLPNLDIRFHTEITGARGESVLEAIDLFDSVQQKAETHSGTCALRLYWSAASYGLARRDPATQRRRLHSDRTPHRSE